MKMVGRGIVVLGIYFLVVACGFAQPQPPAIEWQRRYGGTRDDNCTSLLPTVDGAYLMCGSIYILGDSPTYDDFCIIKADVDGDSMWCRHYGTDGLEACWAARETLDGGYILAGDQWSDNTIGFDFMILKTNAQGDCLWSRTYGNWDHDLCHDVQPTRDGGYFLVGESSDEETNVGVGWLLKTDAGGDSVWSRAYRMASGMNNDRFAGIRPTSDGNYILAGTTMINNDSHFWLIKINDIGDTLWTKTYGRPNTTICRGVRQTTDQGYLLYGWHAVGNRRWDFFVAKTDSVGYLEWSKTYGREDSEEDCYAACQTSDGGFILVGQARFPDTYFADGWIVRTNADGDSLWSMRIDNGVGHDHFNDILQVSDGGFVLGGHSDIWQDSIIQEQAQMWLVKLAPEMSAGDALHPRSIYLLSAYPNPFNSATQIAFTVPVTQRVSLQLYDVLGREVAVLLDEIKTAGAHRVSFDGSGLASGVYFCRMEAGKEARMQKIVLIR